MQNEDPRATIYKADMESLLSLLERSLSRVGAAFVMALVMGGLFLSCTLSIGWNAGESISNALGIAGKR